MLSYIGLPWVGWGNFENWNWARNQPCRKATQVLGFVSLTFDAMHPASPTLTWSFQAWLRLRKWRLEILVWMHLPVLVNVGTTSYWIGDLSLSTSKHVHKWCDSVCQVLVHSQLRLQWRRWKGFPDFRGLGGRVSQPSELSSWLVWVLWHSLQCA